MTWNIAFNGSVYPGVGTY